MGRSFTLISLSLLACGFWLPVEAYDFGGFGGGPEVNVDFPSQSGGSGGGSGGYARHGASGPTWSGGWASHRPPPEVVTTDTTAHDHSMQEGSQTYLGDQWYRKGGNDFAAGHYAAAEADYREALVHQQQALSLGAPAKAKVAYTTVAIARCLQMEAVGDLIVHWPDPQTDTTHSRKAEHDLEVAMGLEPGNPDYPQTLLLTRSQLADDAGRIHLQAKNYVAAIADFKEEMRLDGEALDAAKRLEAANPKPGAPRYLAHSKVCQAALAQGTAGAADALIHQAQVLHDSDRPHDSMESAKEAHALEPTNPIITRYYEWISRQVVGTGPSQPGLPVDLSKP